MKKSDKIMSIILFLTIIVLIFSIFLSLSYKGTSEEKNRNMIVKIKCQKNDKRYAIENGLTLYVKRNQILLSESIPTAILITTHHYICTQCILFIETLGGWTKI